MAGPVPAIVTAGATERGGEAEAVGPQSDYETLSYRVGVPNWTDRRAGSVGLIGENGSGPDGSSLTPNY